jgi:hypothetical protein
LLKQAGAAPADVVYGMIPYAVVAGIGVVLLTYLAKPES